MNWLNPKGNRESVLRMNLKDWKEYIFEKIRGRSNEEKHHKDGEESLVPVEKNEVEMAQIETDSSLSSQESESESEVEVEAEVEESSSSSSSSSSSDDEDD